MRYPLLRLALRSAACVLCFTVSARADDAVSFAFIDESGELHASATLVGVPEPYQGVYRRQEADRARKAAGPAPKPSPPLAPAGDADGQRQAREAWDQTMQKWRRQLIDSTEALRQAESERMTVGNPLLKATPVGHEAWVRLTERIDSARTQALLARRMLMDTLPAQARAQHVPPQWLLP